MCKLFSLKKSDKKFKYNFHQIVFRCTYRQEPFSYILQLSMFDLFLKKSFSNETHGMDELFCDILIVIQHTLQNKAKHGQRNI